MADATVHDGTNVSTTSNAFTTANVPWPVVAAGELILLLVSVVSTSATEPTFTVPAGWTTDPVNWSVWDSGSTAKVKSQLYWRVATGSESGTFSISTTSATTGRFGGTCVSIANGDTSNPIHQIALAPKTGASSLTYVTPAISTTEQCLVLYFVADHGAGLHSAPAGAGTEIEDWTTSNLSAALYANPSQPAGTYTQTITSAGNPRVEATMATIAVRGASSGAAVAAVTATATSTAPVPNVLVPATVRNDFEGTAGSNFTTTSTPAGQTQASAVNLGTGSTATYSSAKGNAQAGGSTALELFNAAGQAASVPFPFVSASTSARRSFRFWVWIPSTFTAEDTRLYTDQTAAAGNIADVHMDTDGTLFMRDAAGTGITGVRSPASIPKDQFVLIQGAVTVATGAVELGYWTNPTGGPVWSASATGAALGSTAGGRAQLGSPFGNAQAATFWFDDLFTTEALSTGFPGPRVNATVVAAPTATGSAQALVPVLAKAATVAAPAATGTATAKVPRIYPTFPHLKASAYGVSAGASDNQAALVNAVAAAKAAGLPLYLQAGTYQHSAHLVVDGVVIFGDGPDVTVLHGTTYAEHAIYLQGTNPGLHNLTVEATGRSPRTSNREGNGVYVVNATGYVVRNVHVQNVDGAGIMVEFSSGGRVLYNQVELNGADGIYHTESSHDVEVAYNRTVETGDDAISITSYSGKPVYNFDIHHNACVGNYQSRAFTVNGTTGGIKIHHNHVDGGTSGISLSSNSSWAGTNINDVEAYSNTLRNINQTLQNTGNAIGGGAISFWNNNPGTDQNESLHDNQIYNPGLYGIYAGGTTAIVATVSNSAFYLSGTLFFSDNPNASITRTGNTTGTVGSYPGDLIPSTVGGLDPSYLYYPAGGIQPPAATASAAAPAPAVKAGARVAVPVPAGSALALVPVVGGKAAVAAAAATSAALAPVPVVRGAATLAPPVAVATSAAAAPTFTAGARLASPAATAVLQAYAATTGAGGIVSPPAAQATVAAPVPAVGGAARVTVAVAAASSMAPVPVVTGAVSATVQAVPATAAAVAQVPDLSVPALVQLDAPPGAAVVAPGPMVSAAALLELVVVAVLAQAHPVTLGGAQRDVTVDGFAHPRRFSGAVGSARWSGSVVSGRRVEGEVLR